jgi:hypothetical protein
MFSCWFFAPPKNENLTLRMKLGHCCELDWDGGLSSVLEPYA